MPRRAPPTAPGTPAHAIARRLAADIASGQPPVGGLLAPEPELQRRFDASRYAVREAVARLRAQGLVSPQRGRGTRVLARRPDPTYVQTLGSTDEVLGLTRELMLTLVDTRELTVDAATASLLDAEPGSPWLLARTLRRRAPDLPPIALVRMYVPPEFRDVIAQVGRHRGPIFELFETMHGIRIAQIDQRVEAVALGAEDARMLGASRGSPALSIVRRFLDDARRVRQVTVGLYPSGRFAQTMRILVGRTGTAR